MSSHSMNRVAAICIVYGQNRVKIEVFGTFIFWVLDHIKWVCQQIQPHSIYQKKSSCHILSIDITFITVKIN